MVRLNQPQLSPFGTLASVVLVVAVLYFAKAILIPVSLAILLSFVLAPVLTKFQRWGMRRIFALITVILLSFSLIAIVSVIVAQQVIHLAGQLPQYKQNIRTKIHSLQGPGGRTLDRATATVIELSEEFAKRRETKRAEQVNKVEIVEPPPSSLEFLRSALGPLVKPFGTAGIVIILVIFMLFKREDLRDRVLRLIGTGRMHTTTEALDDAAARISRYLFMQTMINGGHGLVFGTGLFLIGVPNAALWGLLSALLRFIPYVGPWIGAILPISLSIAVFDSWVYPLLTFGLVIVLEVISNNIIEPWLYASSTGVSSVGLIVAAIFWTWLWGPFGLVLSAPLTVCLVVMGKYIPQLEFLNTLLGDEPVLEPKSRFYQRLLAMDQEEAGEILQEQLKESNFMHLCDTLILPALVLAEQDRHMGILDEDRERKLFADLREVVDEFSESVKKDTLEESENRRKSDVVVLCVPARDEADEIAGTLFAQLLEAEAIEAQALTVNSLAGEMLDTVETSETRIVCISALPPSAVTHARYLCKRLRSRFPELNIIVGLWSAEGNIQSAIERLKSAGATKILSTFEEGLTELRQMGQLQLLEQES